MNELKPCPFCGSKDVTIDEIYQYWRVRCNNYNCQSDGPPDLGQSGAIEAWNTRPLEAQLLEACKEALIDFKGTLEDHVTSDPVAIAMHPTIKQLQAAIAAAEGDAP